MTIYAIGDIHGHLDQLRAAHDRVAADRAREGTGAASLVHLGDLVDRGPDSAGVVECLADLAAGDPRVVVLKGNHDAMFSEFLDLGPGPARSRWLGDTMGGRETLLSYGVRPDLGESGSHAALRAAVPTHHRRFLATLPSMHRAGGCAFVHAGIRPGIPLDAQDEEDLLWIRGPFLFDTRDHGALIVHGHTPVERVELHANRLAIDTGTAWGGPLTAVAIEDARTVFVLTDTGRYRVRPVAP
ncbi:serine/threonine protein phosphatase [Rhodobacterales bacterium HKCCSP123]|nr:serine/threonine protein phosphatase [Rhodobacterales bacterium HKCCSP123]